ncbi:MAG: M1 family aminopeptidase [Burkholderiales bacterium]
MLARAPLFASFRTRLLAALALGVVAALAHAEVPGMRLPRTVVPLAYDARLDLDPARESFGGSIDIAVRVQEATDLVWLNAKQLIVTSAQAVSGGEELAATVVPGSDDVIGLQLSRALPPGEHRLVLSYAGKIDSKGGVGLFRQPEAGRYYAVTQFEPLDARRVFPCFDEPDRKAPWKLTLVVPAATRAFANMPVESERPADGGRKEVVFQRSPPLPSYLVAFAVGEFDVLDAGRAGSGSTPIRIVAPKGRAAEGAFAAQEAGPILAAAERYFGMPYPFPKLDLLAYPRATFGGAMENPGLITYDARNLLARPEELSPIDKVRIAGITAHEVSHLWFGDYVTMAWWDDLWLNEAFASWMGSAIIGEVHPEWPIDGWRARQRSRAMEADRLPGARRVRQPVSDVNDVRTAFDGITYAKGETVIGMFERWLGREKFRDGVRRYMAAHAWGNATADDFFAALGASDEALVPAFRGFVDRPGVPLLDVALDCSAKPTLQLAQQRFLPPDAAPDTAPWTFPACFDYGDGKAAHSTCVLVREPRQSVALAGGACPQWVVANRDGNGYYLPRLTSPLYRAFPLVSRASSPGEYGSLLADLEMLAATGAVRFGDVLPIAAAQGMNPNAQVASRALSLAGAVPDAMVAGADRARYAAYVRRAFGDRARMLGWVPARNESPEVMRLREQMVPFVADRGGDAALARKATQLARRWTEHRAAVPASAREFVLVAAARNGGPDAKPLFDSLVQIARTSKDANEREDVIAALGAFRDPALRSAAFALLLDPQVPTRDVSKLLVTALEEPQNRPAALAWLAANIEALQARVPREQHSGWIIGSGNACTAEERAQVVAVFGARAPAMESGARRYKQALERIDLCLALRAAQQAPLAAFLAAAP